ncbi:MAG: YraN family protein [Chloroflexi bacterium]|nr:YraN family protein [Chloroflexota bacterium]
MSTARQRLGAFGEEVATRRLRELGYRVVERNYRCAAGEIDVVAMDGEVMAFVEVRTRRGDRMGTPEESVGPRKQRKMIEVAQTYVAERGYTGAWRLDVVAVALDERGRVVRCEVIPNAVEG